MTDRAGDVGVSLLAQELTAAVRGRVRVDTATRAMWSADASNYRHVPLGVVSPTDADDVAAALDVARRHGLPILPLGARTSIGGQGVNEAIVLDFRRSMNRVRDVDPDARTARVQPGVVLDVLREAAGRHGLTFGPDPSTHDRCTLGGMIGNNACGSHSVAWGKTVDNVVSLDVLLTDGTRMTVGPTPDLDAACARPGTEGRVYRELRALRDEVAPLVAAEMDPGLTRRVSGYNLDQLHAVDLARALVGTEGTCATVLEATVRLVDSPPARALAVLGFADAYLAADHAPAVREHAPLTIEGMDVGVIGALRAARPDDRSHDWLPEGAGWLYVETGGATAAEARAAAEAITAALSTVTTGHRVVSEPAAMRSLWKIREDGSGIVTRGPGGVEAWPGWEDAAVHPERVGDYLREFDALLGRHGRRGAYYGHFGDGCLHVRIDFDLLTRSGLANFRAFLLDAADLVVAHGGSLSGEHGDGQARAELLSRMYSPQMIDAFARFKGIWDPDDRMNPGRIVRPRRVDEDLRVFVGVPTIRPVTREQGTELAFDHDDGSLARATRRCIGVAKCVTDRGGVMCPSYRVTGEERHSTRGRARLLFEMASGQLVPDGWRSDEVRDALDLCLSCKGCQRDCPVGVDMASYKSEFLAQYYAGRPSRRPRSHWSMGFLPVWARVLAAVPGAPALVNALAQRPAVAGLVKRAGGIAPQRDVPRFAARPLRRVLQRRVLQRRVLQRRVLQRRVLGRRTLPSRALPSRALPSRVFDLAPVEAPPTLTEAEPTEDPRPRILLWPDTFTASFDPEVALDAIGVLESLGYRVELPSRTVCCGLTWFSTGQLATARTVLRRSLAVLRPWLDAGVPVVGLEPSCTAALRSDAVELLGGRDEDADVRRLASSVRTFAEVLADHAEELRARAAPDGGTAARALAQVHCHQYADAGFDADRSVLAALGVDTEVLDEGCCGLAGNFGFEEGHYEVSVACAERGLMPAVRAADPEVTVLADGFSCRTQIRSLQRPGDTPRAPRHLASLAAEVLGVRTDAVRA